MGRLIDADTIVHYQTYDDEHEDFQEHESTIADFLDEMTDEGCPNPVDAVPVRHGRWIHHKGGYSDHYECTACGKPIVLTAKWDFCPNCGADMRGEHEKAD